MQKNKWPKINTSTFRPNKSKENKNKNIRYDKLKMLTIGKSYKKTEKNIGKVFQKQN